VFLLITHLRDAGLEKDDITVRLDAEQQRSWQGLPELPPEFNLLTIPSVPADQAASRAYEMAQVAALQTQVQFLQQQNQDLTLALETARTRVEELEAEIERLRQDKTTVEQGLRDQVDAAKHEQQAKAEHLQDELSKVRAEVARIEGQLSSYSFGRERPLNVGLLLAGAILFGVLLVIVVFVVANLLA
jgi:hypothetical protein